MSSDGEVSLQGHHDAVMHKLKHIAEHMTMGSKDEVKVENIFKGSHPDGSGGGGNWAAILPALMAERRSGWGGDGFGGFGSGLVGGVLGGLLFNRRGGVFGDGDGGNGVNNIDNNINFAQLLAGQGDIKLAVAQGNGDLKLAVAESTNQTTTNLGQLALGIQQGFGNLKDSVVNGNAVLLQAINNTNQNVMEQGCQTRAAITAAADTIMAQAQAFQTSNQQEKINALNAEVIELRNRSERAAETADLRLQITNNNTAVAAQAQGQQQAQQQQLFSTIAGILPLIQGLVVDSQIARATNSNIVVGSTGTTTGAQNANPVNVR